MAEEAGQEAAGGGGGGGIVRIVILVVPALLIGLAGGYFIGQKLATKHAEETEKKEPQAAPTPKDPAELVGEMFKLEPFLVNLNEPRGNRYLKVTVQLEMGNAAMKAEVERRQAQIRDIILSLMSSKTTQDLQAPEGKFRLRDELLSRINAQLINGSVTRVYFTEFVIQ
ncbi:MAG: flagellar basal body-associated FliL family protein [Magnetococcales bacterium]|nr:flagellar basal body-associated FliL family protein [Magnetococcales bacterium]